MPIIKYDYLGRPSLENSELIIIYRPIIPVRISNRNRIYPYTVNCFVDSGSGYSVFHSDDAEALGLKLENGRKIFITVGDGAQIPAYIHKVSVKFAGKEFVGEIAFSPNLGVGTNLLGLASFFEKFSICFHHAKNYVNHVEVKELYTV